MKSPCTSFDIQGLYEIYSQDRAVSTAIPPALPVWLQLNAGR